MRILVIIILSCFFSSHRVLKAFPTEEFFENSGNRDQGNYITDTTTESENKTNIISSVWRKFSNIFQAETTTQGESEMRQEVLMPEDGIAPLERENDRYYRLGPADLNKQSEDRMSQTRKYDKGGHYPIRLHYRKRRSNLHGRYGQAAKVRTTESSEKLNLTLKFIKKKSFESEVKKVPIIIEEFDQGETQRGRMKRFENSWKSTDWKTEKIIVDSDPVEDIDKTNYIQETKKSDFPFHAFSIKPIIVEDSLLDDEVTTLSQKEIPPLKIIDY